MFQFFVSKFSEPNQAREGKHFKMGWITTRILHFSDLGAAITMALTAKLYDIAPAQRKAGSSPGRLSVKALYLSSAHGSFMFAVHGLCSIFKLSTVLRFQHGAPVMVYTVADTLHLSVPKSVSRD